MEQDARERQQLDMLIGNRWLDLDEDAIALIRKQTDYFVRESQGNKTTKGVYLSIYSLVTQDNEFWDKVGKALGHPYESLDALYSALATLPALESIILTNRGRHNNNRVLFQVLYGRKMNPLGLIPRA
jgi:hypothetical protein